MDDVQTPLVTPAPAGPEQGAKPTASSPTRSAVSADVRGWPMTKRRRPSRDAANSRRSKSGCYAETTTPVSEIRSGFGMPSPLLYRVSH